MWLLGKQATICVVKGCLSDLPFISSVTTEYTCNIQQSAISLTKGKIYFSKISSGMYNYAYFQYFMYCLLICNFQVLVPDSVKLI